MKGEGKGLHNGKLALFRHRHHDGSEYISCYGNLNEIGNIAVGKLYQAGDPIGKITQPTRGSSFLHFGLAYGPAWEISLAANPDTPLSAGPSWIRNHYFDPQPHLDEIAQHSSSNTNKDVRLLR